MSRHPNNRQLHDALRLATSLAVVDGGSDAGQARGGNVLFETREPGRLEEIRALLKISDHPDGFGHCLCAGDPTLLFETPAGRIGLSIHHGHAIRWDAWEWDAPLLDGEGLAEWLARHGAPGLQREMEAATKRVDESAATLERWERSIPDCARELWARDRRQILSAGAIHRVSEYLRPFEIHHPELRAQVRELLRWYGGGVGRWSGYPSYEDLPRQILDLIPATSILHLLREPGALDDPRVASGAARYVLGWDFRKKRKKLATLIFPELSGFFVRFFTDVESSPDRLETADHVHQQLSRRVAP
ncbi:MAG: hypothetical protein AAGM22_21615 [Acidobacteriota bacterium]